MLEDDENMLYSCHNIFILFLSVKTQQIDFIPVQCVAGAQAGFAFAHALYSNFNRTTTRKYINKSYKEVIRIHSLNFMR